MLTNVFVCMCVCSPDLSEDLFHRYSHMFVGAGYRSVEIAPFDIQVYTYYAYITAIPYCTVIIK